jgi:galactokinase
MDARTLAAIDSFAGTFDKSAQHVSIAGGRVNLIGEHTDYHDGFVFPAAIDLGTRIVSAKRNDSLIRIYSRIANELIEFSPASLSIPPITNWHSYAMGPFWALREQGLRHPGADIFIDSDLPMGGGLSSSASLQVALIGLGAWLAQSPIPPLECARLARKSENVFCGVPCGIMDQIACACGEANHALLIDCRTIQISAVAFPSDWCLLVADSHVKHSVAGTEYAKRQNECKLALQHIQRRYPQIKAARDITDSILDELRPALDPVGYRRLRHVVSENARTLAARTALESADASAMGTLLDLSHTSLQKDYEVSCDELDQIVEIARTIPGVIGARLTGAGFGGNALILVHAQEALRARASLSIAIQKACGEPRSVQIVRPSCGLQSIVL